jgi:hypothetical protein
MNIYQAFLDLGYALICWRYVQPVMLGALG